VAFNSRAVSVTLAFRQFAPAWSVTRWPCFVRVSLGTNAIFVQWGGW
jgi:hypothetical protein